MLNSSTRFSTEQQEQGVLLYDLMADFSMMLYDGLGWYDDFPYHMWHICTTPALIEQFDELQREVISDIYFIADKYDIWCLGPREYLNNEIAFVNIETFKQMYEDWLNVPD